MAENKQRTLESLLNPSQLAVAAIAGTGIYAIGTLAVHTFYPEHKELIAYMDGLLRWGAGYAAGAGLGIAFCQFLKSEPK